MLAPPPPQLLRGPPRPCGCAHSIAEETRRALLAGELHPARPPDEPIVRTVQKDARQWASIVAFARSFGPVDSPWKAWQLFAPLALKADEERAWVLVLGTHADYRGIWKIAQGSRDRVEISLPDALRVAISEGGHGFILAHNHPSGDARPSVADAQLTKDMHEAASCVGLMLNDHLVLGYGEFFSFRGVGRPFERPQLFEVGQPWPTRT